MTTGIIHSEQNLEKQIEKHMGGCMAGFFSIFDRNHILSSSTHHHHKRLPSSLPPVTPVDSASEYSISCGGSPSSRSGELIIKPSLTTPQLRSSSHSPTQKPNNTKPDSAELVAKSSSSPWKFTRDAPRLSLDSRAVIDAKGKLHPRQIRTPLPSENYSGESDTQRRSPSVVARLMGLDNLPPVTDGDGECYTPPVSECRRLELRRSASESRSRDLLPLHCRLFIDGENGNAASYQSNVSSGGVNVVNGDEFTYVNGIGGGVYNAGTFDDGGVSRFGFGWGSSGSQTALNHTTNHQQQQGRMCPPSPQPSPQSQIHHHITRKGFYDSGDYFPDPKPQSTSSAAVYTEVEKRLRMSGIDEPCRDLETLKQILEALKLKGLLHSTSKPPPSTNEDSHRTFTRTATYNESSSSSPIILMKPARAPPPVGRLRSNAAVGETTTPRRSPVRSPVSPNLVLRGGNDKGVGLGMGMGLSLATRKRMNRTCGILDQQNEVRSGGSSPRVVRGLNGRMEMVGNGNNNVYRRRKNGGEEKKVHRGVEEEDESSTTSTSTETERLRVDEYREGKSLLERCDKLLNSIAEMNTNSKGITTTTTISELQPSPVSVLDSSFYKEDEEDSPSPVMKRRTVLHFKDLDEESWSPSSIPDPPLFDLNTLPSSTPSATELNYISEILRALTYLPDDTYSDLFNTLEKHQFLRGRDTSKPSRLRRRLLFDATTEILSREHNLPPWRQRTSTSSPEPERILSEIQKSEAKEVEWVDENMFQVVCRVMKRDLAEGDSLQGWDGYSEQVSEAVLGIERLVFKDLIGEAIGDMGVLAAGRSVVGLAAPRRRLLF